MPVQVSLNGHQALEAWLGAAPAAMIEGIWKATDDATADVLVAVQGDTPRLTGKLEASEQKSVAKTARGATGRVFSKLRYTPFVERGTRAHGPARQMFQRGLQATLGEIDGLYEGMAVRLTETAR